MAGETALASIPRTAEPRLLGTSMDITVGTALELDSWPTSPPKGDREMNVGVEPSFSDVVATAVKLLPMISPGETTEGGPVATAVPLLPMISPGGTTEEGPVTAAVTLFSIVRDDSDPYPGGTPEEGPLG